MLRRQRRRTPHRFGLCHRTPSVTCQFRSQPLLAQPKWHSTPEVGSYAPLASSQGDGEGPSLPGPTAGEMNRALPTEVEGLYRLSHIATRGYGSDVRSLIEPLLVVLPGEPLRSPIEVTRVSL